jgi:hypothetical protein
MWSRGGSSDQLSKDEDSRGRAGQLCEMPVTEPIARVGRQRLLRDLPKKNWTAAAKNLKAEGTAAHPKPKSVLWVQSRSI